MPLALFAWMWIAAANAGHIIPLTELAAVAWTETVQQGLGLFSGAHALALSKEKVRACRPRPCCARAAGMRVARVGPCACVR